MAKIRHSRFLLSLGCTAALILNMVFFKNPLVGLIAAITYLGCIGDQAGRLLFSQKSREVQFFFGSFVLFLSLLIALTASYYIYGITPGISIATLLLLPTLFLVQPKTTQAAKSVFLENILSRNHIPAILPVFSSAILLFTLYTHRTTDVLPSPWTALPLWIFFLYAFIIASTLYALYRSTSRPLSVLLSSLVFFVSYSVVPLMYPLGFGFDGLIHRATETWIQLHGFITPKQPFYIGQYSLVVWFSNITSIPLFFIDVYFVPLLSALFIPPIAVYTLNKTWRIPVRFGSMLVLFVLLPVFFSLYLTTPYNVLILFQILTVFLILAYIQGAIPFFVPALLSISGLLTHPLIGAPVFLFTFTAFVLQKLEVKKTVHKYAAIIPYTLATVALAPVMFGLYLYIGGHDLPTLMNPFSQIEKFLELFSRPFWYKEYAPFWLEVLYGWQWLIAPVIIALSFIALLTQQKDRVGYSLFPFAWLSFVLSAWLLRSWIVFPNVASFEQGNYPTRLLITSLIFLLPWFLYALYRISVRFVGMSQSRPYKLFALGFATLVTATALTSSFYLSYPQRNEKVHFPGFNVTAADFEAVRWIHEQNTEYNYIVLANLLTSVAALSEYNFVSHFDTKDGELFYYSIPSGGPLYKLFERMIYEGQSRDHIDEALTLTGAEKAYFAVSSYWAGFEEITENAKKYADKWHSIDNGSIIIFEYHRR